MAGYFSRFPYTYYSLDNLKTFQLVTNILRRVKIRDEVKTNASAYINYTIQDGDSLESIAHKLYGDTKYLWIIMHMNEMINPYYDFPLTTNQLSLFVDKKYGINKNAVHHYEDSSGMWVNSTYPNATPKTNAEYESFLNEKKRNIRLLLPEYVGEVQAEFEQIMKNKVG